VTDFVVLYRARDELVSKNPDLEKQNAALKEKNAKMEASLNAAHTAQKSSDLTLTEANRAREAGVK